MHIEVEPVAIEDLMNKSEPEESSLEIRARVLHARQIQSERFRINPGIHCNAQMPDSLILELCEMEDRAKSFLFKQMEKLGLSARSYSRILKVARTIADLSETQIIGIGHIAEAIHFRKLDMPLSNSSTKKQKAEK